jgi:hypothetical protein
LFFGKKEELYYYAGPSVNIIHTLYNYSYYVYSQDMRQDLHTISPAGLAVRASARRRLLTALLIGSSFAFFSIRAINIFTPSFVKT